MVKTFANTSFQLLLGLGLIWTLGLFSFFHFITFCFQKYSVYLFAPVTKARPSQICKTLCSMLVETKKNYEDYLQNNISK
jgi:hypothetical protein